ncbi:thioredoxin domain-containing protein [Flavobacterium branchiophilum]|uniref:Thioredoxin n=1 Tax=Flavobacterium branchiophilum TaxID=55197 RepID=A0A2H3KY90_9FLAO|nr:thioredoxin domain-containing protein [Flavobacterium branchiophilum]PDS26327.1 thioredoxin [Flavobacterium branchiophilum]
MKLKYYLLLMGLMLQINCKGQNAENVHTIEALAFSNQLHNMEKPQLVDVRTLEEFQKQHIEGAANINWNGDQFESEISKLDHTKPVFVYCMSGGRSHKAALKMATMGFQNIIELSGGIMKWNAAGLNQKTSKIIGICPQEYAELTASNTKVLIDFYAEWCAPCQKMKGFLTQMEKNDTKQVKIIRLNADEHPTMIKELNISELPTLLLYENNKLIWKHSGYISEIDLKKQL